MPPKQVVSLRLDPDLAKWACAESFTALVEPLLQAYRERRIIVAAEPAPGHLYAPEPKGVPNMQIQILVAGKPLPTHAHENQTYAEAPTSGDYTIRLRNDGPSRRLAVLSVDGVSVIDGQDARVEGPGYVLGPWETLDVPGWRRSGGEVAAFKFAAEDKSYAAQTGRGTRNVGVIGVAVFDEKVRAPRPIVVEKHVHHHEKWPWYPRPWPHPYTPFWCGPTPVVIDSLRAKLENPHLDISWGTDTTCSVATNGGSSGAVEGSPVIMAGGGRGAGATFRSISKSVDVGTGYGRELDFETTSVSFERATAQPAEIVELRYATRARLKKMGVKFTKAKEAAAPSAFPGSAAGPRVPAPEGWRG